uniref:AF4/FMR2 family, member 2 n=1 Tax=Pundamilia nyererei TaxID=303518 RepID=A0A3B4ESB7_9CICH
MFLEILFDFFESINHLESERSALKRREWERRNQEVQQDEDLFSTGFNLFGEPYKTNKGDALANRVQNTLGSYEEMKDLLTSHSNQSHLVGIPKGTTANSNLQQAPTTSATERPAIEPSQLFNETGNTPSSSTASMQPPPSTTSSSTAIPHQNSKKSRSSMDWSRGGHGQSTQGTGLVVGLGQNGQGQVTAGATTSRGKMSLLDEQQRHDELFSSLKDELENGGYFKSSPFESETGSHLCTSSSPLASTSVLTTPTPGLTTPTSGLTTPTFPPGSLSGKPIAVQQKPTAYVRPMDGQDQAPSDSPQLKPPLVATEGFNSSQAYGGNSGNAKSKLPKLSLNHTGERVDIRVIPQSVKLCAETFWCNLISGDSVRRCAFSASSETDFVLFHCDMLIPPTHTHPIYPPFCLSFFFSGASGSSSESESSSESDTDESESSSSDSEYNQASRTNTPEPEPPSTNKWQLDSWLNKVQAQTKPLVPPQQEHHGTGKKITLIVFPVFHFPLPQSPLPFLRSILSFLRPSLTECMLFSIISCCHKTKQWQALPSIVYHVAWASLPCSRVNLVPVVSLPLIVSPISPAAREKDLLPPPSLEHQNPPRPRSKPPGGKTAPRKEPRSDKRKHRGPSTRITPKSREFIETDSSSSSSECQSDTEEAIKIPALPPQTTRSAINTQTLSNAHMHAPLLPCLGSAGGVGNLEPMSPPSNLGHEVPLSPLREYHEIQSLWVKIDLSLLSRVPGQAAGERSRVGISERDGSEGRDRERQGERERIGVAERERPKQEDREWPGLRERQKLMKGERQEEENERLVQDRERQGERERLTERERVLFSGFVKQHVSAHMLFMVCIICHHYVCRVHSADFYMQEAKRLKHKADALMDKFGKAVNYADGALSFIECGNAMERDPLEAKSPYTMYSETVELIRYAMRLKNFTSHLATIPEKKLAVLCNRCLSLLYLRMFHLKKDHAVKYSRSLMEYFKCVQLSSPVSLALISPSCAPGSSGSVAIPQRIHHMAASHVNITNNILRSYEHWETSDRLAAENFFQELDSVMEPLSQQSSMTELVRYVRQGLHWLRIEAHLL